MNLTMKLVKKNFTADNGNKLDYYVLEYPLADGSVLDVPVKGDKAKILILSVNITQGK